MMGGGRASFAGLPLRRLDSGRNQIIHESPTLDVPAFIVGNFLRERDGQPFGQAAMDLPFHDHRIDDVPAIIDRDKSTYFGFPGSFVDVQHADVSAKWEG